MQGQHVPFPGEPLVGLLDVGLAGAPADPQHAVRVKLARRGRCQRRQQQEEQEAAGPSRLHGPAGRGRRSGRAALPHRAPPLPARPPAVPMETELFRESGAAGGALGGEGLRRGRGGSEAAAVPWGGFGMGMVAAVSRGASGRGGHCPALLCSAAAPPGILRAGVGTAM